MNLIAKLATLLVLLLAGCSGSMDRPSQTDFGTLELPLSVATGGVTFRVHGTIRVVDASDGSVAATIVSDAASASTHVVSLAPGDYRIAVDDGYTCSVDPADETFRGCVYVGATPEPFTITAGTRSDVVLTVRFRFGQDVDVVFATGDARIALSPEIELGCTCPDQGICVSFNGAEPICATPCESGADCRSGQACLETAGGQRVCAPGADASSAAHELAVSFSIEPGAEATRCVVLDLGNASDIRVGSISLGKTAEVSAVTLWAVDDAPATVHDCDAFERGLAGTARPLYVARSNGGIALPNGVAYSLESHQSLLITAHLANTDELPREAAVTVELNEAEAEAGAIHAEAGVLVLDHRTFQIAPLSQFTSTSYYPIGRVLQGASIFALAGLTQAHGTRVQMATAAAPAAQGTIVYDPEWDATAPAIQPFDPALTLDPAGGLRVDCTFDNTSSQTVSFGESVLDEQCRALVFYSVPTASQPPAEQVCLRVGAATTCCPGGTGC
jgi:hypothetical protein